MNILNVLPLVNVVLGGLLTAFILFKKSGLGQQKRIRLVLSLLVLVLTLINLDYYHYLNDYEQYAGISVFIDHLIGFIFLYFIALYTQTAFNFKKWIGIVIGITIIRYAFLTSYVEYGALHEVFNDLPNNPELRDWIITEYLFVGIINIGPMLAGYKLLKSAPLVVQLTPKETLHLKWIQYLIIGVVILLLSITISTFINVFSAAHYISFFRYETLLFAVFFFLLTFSLMHFPIFAFSGNYNDLPEASDDKKYKKSSLTDSSILFEQIEQLMVTEELYLQQELKLNVLADKLESSVHHISQAINENAAKSFPDYINTYRIEAAKKMLLVPNPNTIFAIAIDSGFNSKANFYHVFKKLTGVTPTQFRKSNL